jgi:hypothetical protein
LGGVAVVWCGFFRGFHRLWKEPVMLVELRVAEQRLRAVWEVLDGASTRIGAVALNVSSLGGIREGPGLDVGHVSMQRNQLVPYLRRAQDRRPAVECRPAHILGVADREVLPRPMRSK